MFALVTTETDTCIQQNIFIENSAVLKYFIYKVGEKQLNPSITTDRKSLLQSKMKGFYITSSTLFKPEYNFKCLNLKI